MDGSKNVEDHAKIERRAKDAQQNRVQIQHTEWSRKGGPVNYFLLNELLWTNGAKTVGTLPCSQSQQLIASFVEMYKTLEDSYSLNTKVHQLLATKECNLRVNMGHPN
jgi:hypothetical protein